MAAIEAPLMSWVNGRAAVGLACAVGHHGRLDGADAARAGGRGRGALRWGRRGAQGAARRRRGVGRSAAVQGGATSGVQGRASRLGGGEWRERLGERENRGERVGRRRRLGKIPGAHARGV
jgi:hypothetical protein